MKNKGKMTPMMEQYLEIKEMYKDCILFFRLGDFYEMFFDDAITASRELEITLTGKDCGMEERAPMCGVPFHSVQPYIARLIKRGYKVAICEQTEDPSSAKGIVKRDVVRVITPGTALSDIDPEREDNNFLASVFMEDDVYGVAFADVSTGEVYISDGIADTYENSLINLLSSFKPTEIIMNRGNASHCKEFVDLKKRCNFFDAYVPDEYFEYEKAEENIKSQFGIQAVNSISSEKRDFCVRALGGLLYYLYETQKTDLTHMSEVRYIENSHYMKIDANSMRNLELTRNMHDFEKRGSLLSVLDRTKTSMGARRLKAWLDLPLVDVAAINMRLSMVEELLENHFMRDSVRESLKKVYDIERILSKVVYSSCNARDFLSLRQSLEGAAEVKKILEEAKGTHLLSIYENLETFFDLRILISSAIVDDPPLTVKEGGIIRKGFDKELDRLKDILGGGTGTIAAIEAEEREKTGIKNLKVSYNKVFGYYIEISKSNLDKVPEEYIRKQTLVNAERFITPALKELESQILSSREKVNSLEHEIFLYVKGEILKLLKKLQRLAEHISVVDALCSLAHVADRFGYVKPIVTDDDILDIKDGRHPTIESSLKDSLFVPNDTYLDSESSRFSIITGPNMAGKSTYMRQSALIVIMAQIGSFVPASYAKVGICDAVFTRIGASDDLTLGQSTFMVEMNEVAYILKNATRKSLVILDEIGRGTSTFDGLSIAWAVAEYIADKEKVGAKTLFATHYHELTALEGKVEGIKNYSVAVKKRGDDITFLRKIVKGGTDDSFGIEVALLAGLPSSVTDRAKEVLSMVEEGRVQTPSSERADDAIAPLTQSDPRIKDALLSLDLSTLTPIEALNELYKLQKKVSENE